ncbi:MAG: DUF6686 family protein [Bacteroidota bacterium]
MCPSLRTLKRTKNGVLTFCNQSKLFQLVFNNLCFEFYEWELDAFRKHISELDPDYWEKVISYAPTPRKIPISVGNKCFVILMNAQEVLELKMLLGLNKNKIAFLNPWEINYRYIEN